MIAFVIALLVLVVYVIAKSVEENSGEASSENSSEGQESCESEVHTYAVNDVLRLQSKMPISSEFYDLLRELIPKLEQKKYKRTNDDCTKFPPYEQDERDILFQKLVAEYCENIDPVSDFCLNNSHYVVSRFRENFWWLMDAFFYNIVLPVNADVLYNRLLYLWKNVSTEDDAFYLHYAVLGAVNNLYVYRDDPEIRKMIYALCDYDLKNIVSIRRQFNKMGELVPNLEVAKKKAVMLERDGRIDDAIDLCDFCISHDIIDSGYGSFEKRKEHLLKKKTKLMND